MEKKFKIAIVDDEEAILFTLKNILSSYDIHLFSTGIDALEEFEKNPDFDILIIDYRLPTISGLDLLVQAKELLPSYEAILMTAYSNQELLQTVINENLIFKILNKPVKTSVMQNTVIEAISSLKKRRSRDEALSLAKSELSKYKGLVSSKHCGKHDLIYRSSIMDNLVKIAVKQAKTNANILVTGESGTGKEIFASLLHENSKRANKSIINLNCSTIPEHLFESEMFGHVKGAFTGATSDKAGKFQLANGGTLFFDEISELPLPQQAKLLRVLTDNEILPVGSSKNVKVDVRLICASNRDLSEMAEKGLFRKDLLFRLNTLELLIPPLRDRKEDITYLAAFFLNTISNDEGRATKVLTKDAIELLSSLDYKDNNVRELRNIIYKIIINTDHDFITADDIKLLINSNPNDQYLSSSEILLDATMPMVEFKNFIEGEYIKVQLKKHDGHVTNTAKALGLHTSNLSRKMKQLGIYTA